MASSKQVLLLAAVVAVACLLPSLASARQWVVGDECGWKARFNHTHWANGKTFVVGDTLLFKYRKGKHNVVQVGEEDFATCGHDENHRTRCSGHDVVQLDRPGRMFFICTKHNHCRKGMKLAIDVVVAPPPPPLSYPFPTTSPPPPPPFGWTFPGTPPPPPRYGWPSTPAPPPPPFRRWPW
ncbi:hypothetical protein SORBI_3002G044400, partial [Sorghum bicolor]